MKFGIVVFPGTYSAGDTRHAVSNILGYKSRLLWHGEQDIKGCDVVVLPGGFAFGDYLRAGAIARFSPIMHQVVEFANRGGVVIGICNGFQILCEVGLLPGTLIKNRDLQFKCQMAHLRVETRSTQFSSLAGPRSILRIPIAHGEGNYQAEKHDLDQLEHCGQVVFRYSTPDGKTNQAQANPNGSARNIAGIVNRRGNVLGMMPHPERACEELLGSNDGNLIFNSLAA